MDLHRSCNVEQQYEKLLWITCGRRQLEDAMIKDNLEIEEVSSCKNANQLDMNQGNG